jgi:hypothetical protein
MAPECLEKGNYNSQSDVVSFQIDSHHFQLFFRDSSRGRIECTETQVVSSNPVHGKVYSVQHYVIKFVSNLQQVRGFLSVIQGKTSSSF